MFKRRLYVSLVGVLGVLVALGCGGMVSSDAPKTKSHAKGQKAKLKTAKSSAKKHKKRPRRPDAKKHAESERKNEFVVKLRKGVDKLEFKKGSVKTDNAELDKTFGGLGVNGAGKVHSKGAKNKKLAEYLGLDRTIHIKTKRSKDEVISKLTKHPDVEWVEPVLKVKNMGVPNDPYFSYQWHMKNLNVTEAWKITMGEGVVVAVVDTGVSANEDGFHKLLKGYDFVDNDTDAADGNGHGSHVAGTIGQATDNGIGTVGVAPKVSILPVRVLDNYGSGSNTWVASGIIWAVDNGADIINLSLGSSMNSEVVDDACAYAVEHGVTVVAATGNDGFTDFIGFPAALPSTIAVGSVDAKDVVAFYSNQGPEIDLVGPGGDTSVDSDGDGMTDGVVQETIMDGQWSYWYLQGTSMATPHVAGVAALLHANGVKKPDQIRKALTKTSKDLGKKGFDTVYGHGRVDPVAALKKGKPSRSSEGDKLAISNTRVKKLGGGRAALAWTTSRPLPTMVRGDDGTKSKEEHKVTSHRVTVRGKPGKTVHYTVKAADSTHKFTVKF
jgi:subtilisin family serine protease